jgi:hypothetical protein
VNTLRSWVLCLAVLALASVTALAADKSGISTSKDGRQTYSAKVSGYIPGMLPDAGLKVIYNNISTYPLGRYWCCSGWTISASGSIIGAQFADAMPFTPTSNAHVTKIVVGVGYVTGTNGVTVSLNDDNNGLPGDPIASFDLSNLPTFGTCCVLEIQNYSPGTAVTKGTQYWIVVTTGPNTPDTWDAWNQNDTNETSQTFAFQDNGVWSITSGILGSFAVFGTP